MGKTAPAPILTDVPRYTRTSSACSSFGRVTLEFVCPYVRVSILENVCPTRIVGSIAISNFRIRLSLRAGLDLGKMFPDRDRWFQRRPRGIMVSFIRASIWEKGLIPRHVGYHTQGQKHAQECILRGCFDYGGRGSARWRADPHQNIAKTPS